MRVESPVSQRLAMRNGNIIDAEDYFDHARGSSAAGLSW
jgi:hypothetical protein